MNYLDKKFYPNFKLFFYGLILKNIKRCFTSKPLFIIVIIEIKTYTDVYGLFLLSTITCSTLLHIIVLNIDFIL